MASMREFLEGSDGGLLPGLLVDVKDQNDAGLQPIGWIGISFMNGLVDALEAFDSTLAMALVFEGFDQESIKVAEAGGTTTSMKFEL
jgi:hypothetical protein